MSKRKGRYYEHKAVEQLEADGYRCTVAAGSLGLFDVIGVSSAAVRLIQVKGGKRPYLPLDERAAIERFKVPPRTLKELWRFWRGRSAPQIERID